MALLEVGPGQDNRKQGCPSPSSLWSAVSPGPPSPQVSDRLPTHIQGGRAEEMHPPVHLLESPFTRDQAGE